MGFILHEFLHVAWFPEPVTFDAAEVDNFDSDAATELWKSLTQEQLQTATAGGGRMPVRGTPELQRQWANDIDNVHVRVWKSWRPVAQALARGDIASDVSPVMLKDYAGALQSLRPPRRSLAAYR